MRLFSLTRFSSAHAKGLVGAMLLALVCPVISSADEENGLEPIVVGNPERIEVQPTKFKLDTPRREMRLVVTGYYPGGIVQDLTRAAQFASSNAKVARIEEGIVLPAGQRPGRDRGHRWRQERKGDRRSRQPGKPEQVSFNYGTLVALSKQGCNSGACHGSPSGKGGFRMSLRAYDPVLDTETLIREAFNRRTNLYEPEQSLLLRKPLMEVAHGGGRRLKKGDPAMQLLREWIAEGCQVDPADAPTCVKVEVYPRAAHAATGRPTRSSCWCWPIFPTARCATSRSWPVTPARTRRWPRSTAMVWSSARTAARRRSWSAIWSKMETSSHDVPQGHPGLQLDQSAGEQLHRQVRVSQSCSSCRFCPRRCAATRSSSAAFIWT